MARSGGKSLCLLALTLVLAAVAWPRDAAAGEEEAPELIARARAALEKGDDEALRRLVASDRAGAYEAAGLLLNDPETRLSRLVDELARAYESAFSDGSLRAWAETTRRWTADEQAAHERALDLKAGGIEAFGEGRLEAAAAAFEKALEIFRELGDLREQGRTLSNLGAVAGYAGDGETALARLGEAARATRSAGDLTQAVAIANNHAYALQDLGRMGEARAILEQALPLAESLGDRKGAAVLLLMASENALAESDLESASEMLRRAVELGRQIRDAEVEASARMSLAGVHRRRGDLAAAAAELSLAAEAADASGLPPLQVEIEIRRSELARLRADHPEALRSLRRARSAAAQTDFELLQSSVDLQEALVLGSAGRHGAALDFFDAAEKGLEGADLPGKLSEIRAGRAVSLFYLGRYGESVGQMRAAVEDAAAASRPDMALSHRRQLGFFLGTLGDLGAGMAEVEQIAAIHRETGEALELARDLHLLGTLRLWAGDLTGARETLHEAMDAYPGSSPPGERAEALFDLASVELASGPSRRAAGLSALGAAREAFEALDDAFGIIEVALAQAESDLEAGDVAGAGEALRRIRDMGRSPSGAEFNWKVRYLEGRAAEAAGDLKAAGRAYRSSIAEVESLRGSLRPVRWRAALLESRIAPYRALAGLLLSDRRIREAYATARAAKARTFVEALAPPPLEHSPGPALPLPEGMLPMPAAPLEEIQGRLAGNELLLDYFFQDDGLVVFLVRRDSISFRRLLDKGRGLDELRGLIGIFRHPGRPVPGDEPVTAAWRSAGRRLGDTLLGPLRDAVASSDHILAVPNGPLHGLPFAALGFQGGYLIEGRDVTVLPAAETLLSRRQAAGPAASSTLVLGDPASRETGGRLPGAAEEARQVASLSGVGTLLLLGQEARESAFRRSAGNFDRIHFAVHGKIDRLQPARSYLALSPGDGEDGRLEAREIAEMTTSASLVVLSGCETGIEGGLASHEPPGDERAGLVRAFLAAGAGSVVAGLWEMDDQAAREVIPEIYALVRSRPPVQALAELQRGMITGTIPPARHDRATAGASRGLGEADGRPPMDYSHPFYWAGLQVHGAGKAVPRADTPRSSRTPEGSRSGS